MREGEREEESEGRSERKQDALAHNHHTYVQSVEENGENLWRETSFAALIHDNNSESESWRNNGLIVISNSKMLMKLVIYCALLACSELFFKSCCLSNSI